MENTNKVLKPGDWVEILEGENRGMWGRVIKTNPFNNVTTGEQIDLNIILVEDQKGGELGSIATYKTRDLKFIDIESKYGKKDINSTPIP